MRTYGLFGCLADINEAVHFRWLISSCAWPFPVLGVLRVLQLTNATLRN